jgi:hypothetical protein
MNFAEILSRKDDRAKEMTEFLGAVDPRNYREWSRWFALMVACKRGGVTREAWIDWCTRDPEYAGDAKKIGKRWDSLR